MRYITVSESYNGTQPFLRVHELLFDQLQNELHPDEFATLVTEMSWLNGRRKMRTLNLVERDKLEAVLNKYMPVQLNLPPWRNCWANPTHRYWNWK